MYSCPTTQPRSEAAHHVSPWLIHLWKTYECMKWVINLQLFKQTNLLHSVQCLHSPFVDDGMATSGMKYPLWIAYNHQFQFRRTIYFYEIGLSFLKPLQSTFIWQYVPVVPLVWSMYIGSFASTSTQSWSEASSRASSHCIVLEGFWRSDSITFAFSPFSRSFDLSYTTQGTSGAFAICKASLIMGGYLKRHENK